MAEHLDFTQEANGCFRLAESEAHAEVRTILMGMGYGWLSLASHHKAPDARHQPIYEPTEEPADDTM